MQSSSLAITCGQCGGSFQPHPSASQTYRFCPLCGHALAEAMSLQPQPLPEEATPVGQVPTWYVVMDNEAKGPFTVAQVQSYLQDGSIDLDTWVWTAGLSDWQRGSSLPVFCQLAASCRPAATVNDRDTESRHAVDGDALEIDTGEHQVEYQEAASSDTDVDVWPDEHMVDNELSPEPMLEEPRLSHEEAEVALSPLPSQDMDSTKLQFEPAYAENFGLGSDAFAVASAEAAATSLDISTLPASSPSQDVDTNPVHRTVSAASWRWQPTALVLLVVVAAISFWWQRRHQRTALPPRPATAAVVAKEEDKPLPANAPGAAAATVPDETKEANETAAAAAASLQSQTIAGKREDTLAAVAAPKWVTDHIRLQAKKEAIACFQKARHSHFLPAGKITFLLSFVIQTSGQLTDAKVLAPVAYLDSRLEICLLDAMQHWHFSPIQKALRIERFAFPLILH